VYFPYKESRSSAKQELNESIRKLRQVEIEYQLAGGRLASSTEVQQNNNIFQRIIEYIKLYLATLETDRSNL
jgi:hypothetical protein